MRLRATPRSQGNNLSELPPSEASAPVEGSSAFTRASWRMSSGTYRRRRPGPMLARMLPSRRGLPRASGSQKAGSACGPVQSRACSPESPARAHAVVDSLIGREGQGFAGQGSPTQETYPDGTGEARFPKTREALRGPQERSTEVRSRSADHRTMGRGTRDSPSLRPDEPSHGHGSGADSCESMSSRGLDCTERVVQELSHALALHATSTRAFMPSDGHSQPFGPRFPMKSEPERRRPRTRRQIDGQVLTCQAGSTR